MSQAPKRVHLDSDSEDDLPPWRNSDFFKGDQSFKIGSLRIRCFFNTIKFAWCIFFKKKLMFNEQTNARESHFSFPLTDATFVAKSIREIVQELLLLSTKPTSGRAKFTDCADSFKDISFWSQPFCHKSPSGSIILRGFCDNNNALSVRILCPKNSQQHPQWLGSSGTIPILHALEFAELITAMKLFTENADKEYIKHVSSAVTTIDLASLGREGPTAIDLMRLNSKLPEPDMELHPSFTASVPFANEDEEMAARTTDDLLLTLTDHASIDGATRRLISEVRDSE
jgi:hypothetical protein